jgi:hypothetical protein
MLRHTHRQRRQAPHGRAVLSCGLAIDRCRWKSDQSTLQSVDRATGSDDNMRKAATRNFPRALLQFRAKQALLSNSHDQCVGSLSMIRETKAKHGQCNVLGGSACGPT